MRKFTENTNEKITQYSADQKLFNEIYDMIEESLTPKMNGEVSEKISLIGHDELVKQLSKFVECEVAKSKIKVLENYKSQPTMIQESIENEDMLFRLVNESRSQEKTYSNPLEQYMIKEDCGECGDDKKSKEEPKKCEKCGELECDCDKETEKCDCGKPKCDCKK